MFSDLYISEIKMKDTLPGDSYYSSLPAVRHLKETHSLALERPVTFFVGENGTGKSTLLEAVAVAFGFNPEGGTRNFTFSTKETHSSLGQHLTLVKGVRRPKDGFFLRAESFYNVASEVDELSRIPARTNLYASYGGKSLHEQSHGESFMALVENRFGGHGVYVLDEPEAALSPTRQMALLARIHELVEKNSQFIIATHSPILMAYPDADIYVLSEEGMTKTSYEETEHYQLTRAFLNNPQRMLGYLLDETQ